MVATPASCPHRPQCPGCPRFGEAGLAPVVRRALDALAHRHGLPPVPVVSGAVSGFRLRSRLAIRGRLDSPKIGMFESGTHRVVTIPSCSVQHPLVNRVASVVRRALVDAAVPPYSDNARLGIARYLQVVVERASQTAQVVLVGNCVTREPLAQALDLVRERLGADLHSLWFNAQREPTNAILGPHFERVCGPESVVERFGGAAIHYPPGAFGQNNLDVAERIVEHVRSLVPEGACVAEFYAGVGAIGLSLLPRVRTLRMNELGEQSLHGLRLGVADLDATARARIEIVPGTAGDACDMADGADVVIADPPRKGLDAPLLQKLRTAPPERFIYVSCGLDSLLADAERLTSDGGMRLAGLHAFDLMPYTEHVETVAVFERR